MSKCLVDPSFYTFSSWGEIELSKKDSSNHIYLFIITLSRVVFPAYWDLYIDSSCFSVFHHSIVCLLPCSISLQAEVCAGSVADTVQAVVNGADGCLFCYGHAHLGKNNHHPKSPLQTHTLPPPPQIKRERNIHWLPEISPHQQAAVGLCRCLWEVMHVHFRHSWLVT